jgi:hypothetical protein
MTSTRGGKGGPAGLTREVETPLPSTSPHDPMMLRVDLGGLTREVERPLPLNSPRCDRVIPFQFDSIFLHGAMA